MAKQPTEQEHIDRIEQNLLTLNKIAVAVEFWRYRAKCQLFELRTKCVPNSHPESEICLVTLTAADLRLLARLTENARECQPSSQSGKTDKSGLSSSVSQLPQQEIGSFLSLKISSDRYKSCVVSQKWSTRNIRSHQSSDSCYRPQFPETQRSTEPSATTDVGQDVQLVDRNTAANDPISNNLLNPQLNSDLGERILPQAAPSSKHGPVLPSMPSSTSRSLRPEPTAAKRSPIPAQFNSRELIQAPSSIPNAIFTLAPTQPNSSASKGYTQVKSGGSQTSHSTLDSSTIYERLLQQASNQPGQRRIPNPYLARENTHGPESIRDFPKRQTAASSNAIMQAAAVLVQEQSQEAQISRSNPAYQSADDGESNKSAHSQPQTYCASTRNCTPAVPSGLGEKFLTKKIAQQPNQNARPESSCVTISSSVDHHNLRRQSSSSIEVLDDRPRQRRRIEPNRVLTPPLNSNTDNYKSLSDNVKDEEQSPASFPHERVNTGKIDEYDAAPRPNQRMSNDNMFMADSRASSAFRQRQSVTSEPGSQFPSNRDLNRNFRVNKTATVPGRRQARSSSTDSDTQSQSRSCSRAKTGTPSIIANAALSPSFVQDRNTRPVRRVTQSQRQPGSYRTPAYKPLTPGDRITLELRFCAQVAKIIGSKRCVSEAPVPFDNVPIFQRFRQRFGGKNAEDGDDAENGEYEMISSSLDAA